ncbi:DUF4376 domain-containing protein [Anaeroarcus burkinensis]|uniref:DUF4376 domain-containing protein n=1 Tax=Anaeroarcus burkinensis TaxID=82376 RepID=UPI0003F84BAA|nr:DUF4376 domain-containing protein [Anaeroarcus burkinensis]
MVKVYYDSTTGEILGFYPGDISYASIPEPHIEIDEVAHQDCVDNQGLRRVDLKTLQILEYMPPGPTLAELQAQAWNRIKTERDRREQSGAPYLSKILDSDEKSVTRISIAVQAAQAAISAGTEFSLDWTMQDNSVVTMDADQVVGMSVALAAHSNAIHQAARVARIAIDEAKSDKEVEAAEKAIVWPE